MSYKVSLWAETGGLPEAPKFYMSRAQAIHGMRKLAHSKLGAFGKLDTQAAHDVMAAIEKCDDILQPQECRTVTLSNTGYSLAISNTARQPR
jgi:hypothetical protein